ncbi:5107_t:CDS:2, partial [Rhizophagus irregularis]
ENVIADVNEDASEKIANELNVNNSEIIAIFHKTDGCKQVE